MLVFDATPLIYLAKTGRLGIIEKFEEKKIIPRSVYNEVNVEGKPDARTVEKLVDKGVFEIREVEKGDFYNRLRQNPNVSDADVAVLTLAKHESSTAVMDEDYGRNIADVEGIENRGTVYLLLKLLKQGDLSKEEVKETVDSMIDEGWYCSTELYSDILSKIEDLS